MARPHDKSKILPLSLLCLAVIMAGCNREAGAPGANASAAVPDKATPADKPAKPTPAVPQIEGEWQLVAIDRTQLSQGDKPTLVFGKEGWCWGNTGVNDFRSSFSLEDMKGRMKIGNAAVTRKMGPPEAMALERLFLQRLENAKSFEVVGDLLYLHSGENQNLTFERVYPR